MPIGPMQNRQKFYRTGIYTSAGGLAERHPISQPSLAPLPYKNKKQKMLPSQNKMNTQTNVKF